MRKFYFLIISFAAVALLAAGCQNPLSNSSPLTNSSNPMRITSTAFSANATIPTQYTCDGQNINPPLAFSDIPPNAKTLVLLVDDPDVPKNLIPSGVFDHWVVYNITPGTNEIPENSSAVGTQGKNGAGKVGYTGPCPPDKEHRYFFKLYALDTTLEFSDAPTKQQVETAMQNHIIGQAELVGRYNRRPQNQQ
jgi:Raf kinase inhibitor-like YbhB/YbcL family protein